MTSSNTPNGDELLDMIREENGVTLDEYGQRWRKSSITFTFEFDRCIEPLDCYDSEGNLLDEQDDPEEDPNEEYLLSCIESDAKEVSENLIQELWQHCKICVREQRMA